MAFQRSTLRYGDTPEPVTPYQKAAQVWDERIGSARVQARNWRLMALGSLGLSLVLAGILFWLGRSSNVVPYIVEVDPKGGARAVGPAAEVYKPSDAQIAFHLARFVENVRGLSIDPVVVRQSWLKAQARESPLLFRLQQKVAPREATPQMKPVAAPDPVPRLALTDTGLESLRASRAADRARGLGTDDRDLATDPTDQTRKLSFLRAGPEKEIYNPHALQTPVSPYQVMAGAVIAASLVSGLSSDLPGFVIAQFTEHVYDTISGRHLLIPQGPRLVGKYDSVVAFGQDRALVVWQRIIRPDGSSIVIDNLPATDCPFISSHSARLRFRVVSCWIGTVPCLFRARCCWSPASARSCSRSPTISLF